jgi:hypothetical protein
MPRPPQRRESLGDLAERPHWTVADGRATYAPTPGGWKAVLSDLRQPVGQLRYHVAIVDRTGAARFVNETASLRDAIQSAERGVLARNALRIARPRLSR